MKRDLILRILKILIHNKIGWNIVETPDQIKFIHIFFFDYTESGLCYFEPFCMLISDLALLVSFIL